MHFLFHLNVEMRICFFHEYLESYVDLSLWEDYFDNGTPHHLNFTLLILAGGCNNAQG